MDEIITQQWGAFGSVFLLVLTPLALFAGHQTRALAEAQKARVEDTKAVSTTVIAVVKDFAEAAREQVKSQAEQRAASEKVSDAIDRFDLRLEAKLTALVDHVTKALERKGPQR
jgi:hypothetical protein